MMLPNMPWFLSSWKEHRSLDPEPLQPLPQFAACLTTQLSEIHVFTCGTQFLSCCFFSTLCNHCSMPLLHGVALSVVTNGLCAATAGAWFLVFISQDLGAVLMELSPPSLLGYFVYLEYSAGSLAASLAAMQGCLCLFLQNRNLLRRRIVSVFFAAVPTALPTMHMHLVNIY